MQKVWIVQRVEPVAKNQKYATETELRAYASAQGASDKIKRIYDRLLSVYPAEFHPFIVLEKSESTGLYKSVKSSDNTKWSVVELEVR